MILSLVRSFAEADTEVHATGSHTLRELPVIQQLAIENGNLMVINGD